jgi:hypothetical protein
MHSLPDAERKQASPADRTIVAVEDQGLLQGLSNTRVLLDNFFDHGIRQLLVSPEEGSEELFERDASHWWMLRMKSGLRVAFIGTPVSFACLARGGGQAHLFEFGKSGKLA